MPRIHDHVGERGSRPRADVEPLGTVGQPGAERGVLAACIHAGDVLRQVNGLALRSGLFEQSLARVDLVGLEQRVADGVALRGEEREAHRAADHERIDNLEQGLDDTELVGDLRPAEHGDERMLRVVAQTEKYFDLLLQEAAHR